MEQYSKGQKVKLTSFIDGINDECELTLVTGHIFSITPVDGKLQYLTIYGTTTCGKNVKVKTYNDDKSLELIPSPELNTYGDDNYSIPDTETHLKL